MRFFNDTKSPVSLRVNGARDITVKSLELSPFIDYFEVGKSDLKYIFSRFPVCFESKTEQYKFDKKRVPYKLYTKPVEEKVVVVKELPEMPAIVKKDSGERFVESKKMEVEEVKLVEPKEEKWAITETVEKSIFEIKEKETLKPVKAMEDHEEDIQSGSLARVLDVADTPLPEPKTKDYDPFADMTSAEMTLFTNGKAHKELIAPKKPSTEGK